jgi:hypothetical protein
MNPHDINDRVNLLSHRIYAEKIRENPACQSAPKVDPLSASKVDPLQYGSGRPDAAGRDCAVGATADR